VQPVEDANRWDVMMRAQTRVPLQQSWGYGAVMQRYGAEVHRVQATSADGSLVAFQWLERRICKWFRLMWLPRGLAGVMPEQVMPLLRFLQEKANRWRGQFFFAMPEWAEPGAKTLKDAGFHRVITPYHTVWCDLSIDDATRRQNLHKKWRYSLQKAEDSSLTWKELSTRDPDFWYLLKKENHQQQRLGYRGLPPTMLADYENLAGEGSLLAISAYLPGGAEPVAGMIFLLHHGSATYQLGWNGPDGRAHHAHHLLMWQAQMQLASRGIRWLDLGGVNTEESAGVARFKLGLGGEVMTLAGTFF
jgi:hypothetical protein